MEGDSKVRWFGRREEEMVHRPGMEGDSKVRWFGRREEETVHRPSELQQSRRIEVEHLRATDPRASPMHRISPRLISPQESPLHSLPVSSREKTFGFITSIFKKNKKADGEESSDASPHSLPSIDEDIHLTVPVARNHYPMNFGLATVFSFEELEEATNYFDPQREIGRGGFGRVYLGQLRDKRMVAVKKLQDDNPKLLEQFFNEVTVLSRLRHKNLVSLYGCTHPNSRELLLVYEYVSNGTVDDNLQHKQVALPWSVRMQIAIETAEALAYLHSVEPPIIHRDVKTSNILLDKAYHVKVADLGMCRLLPWDTSEIKTTPQGTVGYRDPEYDLYCTLTYKSDVYSFGVVLLELISGKQAVDVNRELSDIYLTKMALNKILNKELDQLVDQKLEYHSDSEIKRMVNSMAELACRCLQTEGSMRPHMVEVVSDLKRIRDGSQPIICQLVKREDSDALEKNLPLIPDVRETIPGSITDTPTQNIQNTMEGEGLRTEPDRQVIFSDLDNIVFENDSKKIVYGLATTMTEPDYMI